MQSDVETFIVIAIAVFQKFLNVIYTCHTMRSIFAVVQKSFAWD